MPSEGWISSLKGISPEMMKIGLEKMARVSDYKNWPPSALAFRDLCMPVSEDLGLLAESEAFSQATRQPTDTRPRAPEVIHTLRQMGDDSYKLKHSKADTAEKLFKKYWDQTVEFVAAGGDLPELEKAIEEVKIKAPPEVMKKGIDDLMNMFSDC